MSSITRALTGENLTFDLAEHIAQLREDESYVRTNCSCAIGYTASAWIGGSRSISIPGWDDVDDETQAYTVEKDDIISHGVYVRVSLFLSP